MRVEDSEVTGQIHEGAELQPTKGPIRIPAALSALRPVLLRDMRNKRTRPSGNGLSRRKKEEGISVATIVVSSGPLSKRRSRGEPRRTPRTSPIRSLWAFNEAIL